MRADVGRRRGGVPRPPIRSGSQWNDRRGAGVTQRMTDNLNCSARAFEMALPRGIVTKNDGGKSQPVRELATHLSAADGQ
jgi:hypothetical protein